MSYHKAGPPMKKIPKITMLRYEIVTGQTRRMGMRTHGSGTFGIDMDCQSWFEEEVRGSISILGPWETSWVGWL
jgi:hypothetical protein